MPSPRRRKIPPRKLRRELIQDRQTIDIHETQILAPRTQREVVCNSPFGFYFILTKQR